MSDIFENLCGTCKHKNCCTDSAVPLVFDKDFQRLKHAKKTPKTFLKTVKINEENVRAIKKKENSKECVFWDSENGGCSIYESRPIDCRLYPFDIMKIDGVYRWIVYSCNENSDWKWTEQHLLDLEKDDGFDDLIQNISKFSDHTEMVLPTESEKTPYAILRKVNC